jgi:hypothetical protein
MEIDPHHLPEDAKELRRLLLHTLAQLDSTQKQLAEKDRELVADSRSNRSLILA